MVYRKLCSYCGHGYTTSTNSEKFCSNVCRQLSTRKEEIKAKQTGICIVCNTEFTKKMKNEQYCSSECKSIMDLEKHKVGEFIILNRDNFTCIYCGRSPAEDSVKLHIDHVIPLSKGGKSNAGNLVTSCHMCNLEKHNKIIHSDKILETIKFRNKKNNILDEQLFKPRATKNRIDRLVHKPIENAV